MTTLTDKDIAAIQRALSGSEKWGLRLCYASIVAVSLNVALLVYTIFYTCSKHNIPISSAWRLYQDGLSLSAQYSGISAALYLTFVQVQYTLIILLMLSGVTLTIVAGKRRQFRIYQALYESGQLSGGAAK